MNILLIFAHRGYSLKAPENTISAFVKAFEEGADGVELDVRCSKDGYLIVIHDSTLERTTNGKGFVDKYTLNELKNFVIGSNEHIPLLREALRIAYIFDKMLLIDLKVTNVERKLVKEIKEYKMIGKVIVTNQYFICSRKIKDIEPKIKTALLLYKGLNYTNENPIRLAKEYKADYIHMADPYEVTEKLVAEAHENGLGVIAGTTDDPRLAHYFFRIGVDAATPNDPVIYANIKKPPHIR